MPALTSPRGAGLGHEGNALFYILVLVGLGFALGVPGGIVAYIRYDQLPHLLAVVPYSVISWLAFREAGRLHRRERLLDEAARVTIDARTATGGLAGRLENLNELKARGLISDEEYDRQRARIIEEL